MRPAPLGQDGDVQLLQLRRPLVGPVHDELQLLASPASRTERATSVPASTSTRNRPPPDTAPDSAARTSAS